MKGATYVGDTPCTWCEYGKKITVATATSASVSKLD
jgi:hypothetical protein